MVSKNLGQNVDELPFIRRPASPRPRPESGAIEDTERKKSRQAKNEDNIIQQKPVQQKSRRRAINEDDITMDAIIARKRGASLGACEASSLARAKTQKQQRDKPRKN